MASEMNGARKKKVGKKRNGQDFIISVLSVPFQNAGMWLMATSCKTKLLNFRSQWNCVYNWEVGLDFVAQIDEKN